MRTTKKAKKAQGISNCLVFFAKNSLKLIGRKKQPDTKKEKGHVKTVNNGFQHVRDLYMTKDDQ